MLSEHCTSLYTVASLVVLSMLVWYAMKKPQSAALALHAVVETAAPGVVVVDPLLNDMATFKEFQYFCC